jgi:hypothetical protein
MTARIRVETLRREGSATMHLEFSIPTGQDSFPLKVTLQIKGVWMQPNRPRSYN